MITPIPLSGINRANAYLRRKNLKNGTADDMPFDVSIERMANEKILSNPSKWIDIYCKNTGVFMSSLENMELQVRNVEKAIKEVSDSLIISSVDATKKLGEVSAKLRDGTDKMQAAMSKFAAVTNNANFTKTAETAASLVESLERLAVLQRTGQLDKLLHALSSK